jgi:hypothetical protein
MNKLLLFLSFVSLVVLAVGTSVAPNSQIFILASNSAAFDYIREGLAAILLVQLVTKPPRHVIFRLLTGSIALVVGGWAVLSALNGTMPVLDVLSIASAATAIGVTTLEVRQVEKSPRKNNNPLLA